MANGSNEQEYMLDPQGRPRFFGLYEGTVVDINDPLKKNRIKLSVTVTGKEVTNWAKPLLPITVNSNHPDHQEHTAAQIAALLTTTSATVTSASGGSPSHTHSVTVPALTVVAKAGAGTLKHPHKTTANTTKKWNDATDISATEEHTLHRLLPKKGQKVWVMFVAGLANEPVWVGVQEPK
jgi:hypothetical protein